MKTIPATVVLVLALAATGAASATPWRVLPGSSLGFATSYQGESFEGSFAKFSPRIEFDPKQLASARFDVGIELASAGTKNDERDEALRGADFFNTGKSPQAHYLATKFRALGGNRYVADGTLTLNGISKPVALAFTWTPGAQTVLAGSATVQRLDFKVGTGDWTDLDLIPNDVKVSTHLLLASVAAKKP